MLSVSPVPTRATSLAQTSAQSPQTFNDSLLAVSKTYSSTGSENQAGTGSGRPQKPVSQDAKLPPSASHVRPVQSPAPPQKTVQQQLLVAQQPPLVNQSPIPMGPPFGAPDHSANNATVATGQPMRNTAAVTFFPIEPKLAQPVVAKSDSIPSSHAKKEDDSPQEAAVLPLVPHALQTAADLFNAFTFSNPLSINANVFAKAVQAVLSGAIQKAVPSAVSTETPSAVPSVAPTALPSAVLTTVPITDSSAVSNPVPSAAPSVPSTTFPNAALKAVPIADSSAVSSPVSSAAPSVVSSAIEKPLPDAIPTVLSVTFPTPGASSNPAQAPVSHDVVNPSARGDVAPKSNSVPTSHANPPAVTPDPNGLATGLSVPGATADQLVILIQPGGGCLSPLRLVHRT